MDETLHYSQQDIFEEIVERGMTQGVVTEAAYTDLVEAVLEERRGVGELHDDNNIERMEDEIQALWPEYRRRIEAK